MSEKELIQIAELEERCEQLEAENLRLAQELKKVEDQIREYNKIFYGEAVPPGRP